jgi:hypothetical protein
MFEKSRLLPEPPPNPPILGDSGIKVPQNWGLSACGKQEKGAFPEHLILFKHPLRSLKGHFCFFIFVFNNLSHGNFHCCAEICCSGYGNPKFNGAEMVLKSEADRF